MHTLMDTIDDRISQAEVPETGCVDELRVPLADWTDPAAANGTAEGPIVRSID